MCGRAGRPTGSGRRRWSPAGRRKQRTRSDGGSGDAARHSRQRLADHQAPLLEPPRLHHSPGKTKMFYKRRED